ncbi:MAG TPA: OB-fold domain-containing protein [Steroidobacteraceae bacterium]|nr:OB-fold domain-containing protein [Steroidobacteraceae bacterium]
MAAPRVLPRLDSENRFFWTSGAEGQLRFLRCQNCRSFIHPPRPVCRHCLSENVAPEAVAGTGIIDTFTVNYQQWRPGLEVPYVIARVAIDGAPGVFLTTNIVGCPVEAVAIGDRVRVRFEQHGEIYLPLFERLA